MSSPLSFLRPLRYDRVRAVLLVQTDVVDRLPAIVVKLREIFPGCSIRALVREADAVLGRALDVEEVEVARWEDRYDLLSRLRRHRFDAVVLQLGGNAASELRLLPFLMRARYVVAFNHTLDYFPLNVFRLTALAEHFSLLPGETSSVSALLWMVRSAVTTLVVGVTSFVYLTAAVGWLHVRGWWRRRRRPIAAVGANRPLG